MGIFPYPLDLEGQQEYHKMDIKTYLGGDIQRAIGDVQIPNNEDEAGRHAGGALRAVNGTVVGFVRGGVIYSEAFVQGKFSVLVDVRRRIHRPVNV